MAATTTTPITFEDFSNIIDGKCSNTKRTRQGINPSTLESLKPVPVSESPDVDLAISAAKRAARAWGRVPLAERQNAVTRYADALEARSGDFATMLVQEQGKPLSAATAELQEAVKFLRVIATLPFEEQQVIEDTKQHRVVTRYVPIGVSVGIVPWNFPILLYTFKVAPAMVAGCPMIVKPSPFTPYSTLKLVELAQSFFPPGILQALSGDDSLGPLLTAHPGVDKVSFTGSTATGRKVMESCAKTLKRVTLELGGNDAAIVCSNVDIESTAQKVTAIALYNSGQVCVAIKRIYIHSSIYRDFANCMVKFAESLPVGDGFEKTTFLGPVQNAMQYEQVQEFIRSVRAGDLQLASGNTEHAPKRGYFINPIIVDNPPEDSKIVTEEPFGPIFPVLKWDSEEDVIQRANNTDMGLGASIWTRDAKQSERLSKELEVGNIWVNSHAALRPDAAFGGHKSSGVGSELGIDGIKSYCNTQTLYVENEN